MKAGTALFVAVAVIVGGSWTPARAELYDFTIRGTFGETLTSPDESVTLFSEGDAFTIQGTYDTGLPAVVETKSDGDVTMTGFSTSVPSLGYLRELKYMGVTELTFTGDDSTNPYYPMDLINQYYPSDGSANNSSDTKNGAYTADYIWQYPAASLDFHQFNVEAYDTYTNVYVNEITDSGVVYHTAWIYYNYRTEGPYNKPVHSTIDLTIDSFEVAEHVVPLPGSVVLLASAMTTVFGLRRKLRA